MEATPEMVRKRKKEWKRREVRCGRGGKEGEREVEKACGGVKMGCIMTPMPNHLSTRLTTHLLMSGGVRGR